VLPLLRWVRLSTLLVPEPRSDGVLLSRLEEVPPARLLDLLGVRYVITNPSTPDPPDVRSVDFGDLRLHVRPQPVPRAVLVFDARVSDDQAALARLAAPDFDPNGQLVLSPDGGTPTELRSPRAGQPIAPTLVRPDRWRARVSAPEAGYVLQREAWYPGWRARVDGVDVPLLRANVLFRAVPIPAGDHDVEIYFASDAFITGAVTTIIALSIIGLLLVWRR
jgi:hypothetical protein